MARYKLLYDPQRKVLVKTFTGEITYHTLLESLNDLKSSAAADVEKIVIDFFRAGPLRLVYSQLITYRLALRMVAETANVGCVAIIGPPSDTWDPEFQCGFNQEFHSADMDRPYYIRPRDRDEYLELVSALHSGASSRLDGCCDPAKFRHRTAPGSSSLH